LKCNYPVLKRHEVCLHAIGEHLMTSLVLPGAELEVLFAKHGVVMEPTLCLPAHLAADLRQKGLLK
jgi:hypothetical protein